MVRFTFPFNIHVGILTLFMAVRALPGNPSSPAALPKPPIVAYLSSNKIDTSSIPVPYMSIVNYAFLLPDSSSFLRPISPGQQDSLTELIEYAHRHKVKVLASIGGWNIGSGGGNPSTFNYLTSSFDRLCGFSHHLLELCRQFHLDGIDVDWEYPRPDDSTHIQYDSFLADLSDSLHSNHLSLSVAVAPMGYYARIISDSNFKHLDWINVMAYDATDSEGHPLANQSSYTFAIQALGFWTKNRQFPAERIALGIPFFGKTPDGLLSSYKDLVRAGADPQSDFFKGFYYNGMVTAMRKAQLALKNGSGIMVWELSQDTTGSTSLLKAIYHQFKQSH